MQRSLRSVSTPKMTLEETLALIPAPPRPSPPGNPGEGEARTASADSHALWCGIASLGFSDAAGGKLFSVHEKFFTRAPLIPRAGNRNFPSISNPAFWHARCLPISRWFGPAAGCGRCARGESENFTINRIGEMLCPCGIRTGAFNH